jgi:apolipoprotein D and lipocalin family protein
VCNGNRRRGLGILWVLFAALLLTGCLGMPPAVTPVQGFDADRYLGKWYEIARLDHSFEEGLDRVTAQYALREDGGITVINRGFLTSDNEWQEAQGKAFFVNRSDEGYLKVSFFGPFYGSYIVFELDKENYQYAFVSGPDTSYLWLLARTPTVDPALIERFVAEASRLGFDTSKLIYPAQE